MNVYLAWVMAFAEIGCVTLLPHSYLGFAQIGFVKIETKYIKVVSSTGYARVSTIRTYFIVQIIS
jgi:hypothetical protein